MSPLFFLTLQIKHTPQFANIGADSEPFAGEKRAVAERFARSPDDMVVPTPAAVRAARVWGKDLHSNAPDAELALRTQQRNPVNNAVHVKDGQAALDFLFCETAWD